jgi:RNA polymerase sigma-70 factor, ECF subfamily
MGAKRANSAAVRNQFEALALPHLDAIYTAALRLARNADDAKDLLQDTILRAYRFFYQFTPGTNCRAWLLTILYNNFRNHLRQCSRQPVTSQMDESPTETEACRWQDGGLDNPEEIAEQRGTSRQLLAAINALPVEFREAMLLIDVQELTYAEVARVLQVPLGTVKSRVSRARAAMRAILLGSGFACGKTGT